MEELKRRLDRMDTDNAVIKKMKTDEENEMECKKQEQKCIKKDFTSNTATNGSSHIQALDEKTLQVCKLYDIEGNSRKTSDSQMWKFFPEHKSLVDNTRLLMNTDDGEGLDTSKSKTLSQCKNEEYTPHKPAFNNDSVVLNDSAHTPSSIFGPFKNHTNVMSTVCGTVAQVYNYQDHSKCGTLTSHGDNYSEDVHCLQDPGSCDTEEMKEKEMTIQAPTALMNNLDTPTLSSKQEAFDNLKLFTNGGKFGANIRRQCQDNDGKVIVNRTLVKPFLDFDKDSLLGYDVMKGVNNLHNCVLLPLNPDIVCYDNIKLQDWERPTEIQSVPRNIMSNAMAITQRTSHLNRLTQEGNFEIKIRFSDEETYTFHFTKQNLHNEYYIRVLLKKIMATNKAFASLDNSYFLSEDVLPRMFETCRTEHNFSIGFNKMCTIEIDMRNQTDESNTMFFKLIQALSYYSDYANKLISKIDDDIDDFQPNFKNSGFWYSTNKFENDDAGKSNFEQVEMINKDEGIYDEIRNLSVGAKKDTMELVITEDLLKKEKNNNTYDQISVENYSVEVGISCQIDEDDSDNSTMTIDTNEESLKSQQNLMNDNCCIDNQQTLMTNYYKTQELQDNNLPEFNVIEGAHAVQENIKDNMKGHCLANMMAELSLKEIKERDSDTTMTDMFRESNFGELRSMRTHIFKKRKFLDHTEYESAFEKPMSMMQSNQLTPTPESILKEQEEMLKKTLHWEDSFQNLKPILKKCKGKCSKHQLTFQPLKEVNREEKLNNKIQDHPLTNINSEFMQENMPSDDHCYAKRMESGDQNALVNDSTVYAEKENSHFRRKIKRMGLSRRQRVSSLHPYLKTKYPQ